MIITSPTVAGGFILTSFFSATLKSRTQ